MSRPSGRWAHPAAGQDSVQLAVFTLGTLEYAIDIMRIITIIRPQPIRPVPQAPEYVDGVIDLRGTVVPVVDLRRRFGLAPDPDERAAKFVIVRVQGRQLGLVVDRVLGVHRVTQDQVREAPQLVTGSGNAVFTGVCRREGRLVFILDLPVLLSTREELRLGVLTSSTGDDWFDEALSLQSGSADGWSGHDE